MSKEIVIIGAGFSGFWSALSAKRFIDLEEKEQQKYIKVTVTVIAPQPTLVIRPRLYEANPSSMTAPLTSLLESVGVNFVQGYAEKIDTEGHTIEVRSSSRELFTVGYDRLVLAAGSSVIQPNNIPGLLIHAFNIDSIEAASKLDAHLKNLPKLPESAGRDTIVVCGAGFTGMEIVTELPKRTTHMPTPPRLILLDSADVLGASLGPGPRPILTKAVEKLGIEVKINSTIASVSSDGITLSSSEHIATKTVIWTAGVRATSLTHFISGEKDTLNRLFVDKHLRVPSSPHIFATGDAAAAQVDTNGNYTLMSCQHAMPLGKVSGFNAVADLLNLPLAEYAQPTYVTCLDLGAFGAFISRGWEREVEITGEYAKRVKRFVNREVIYPPQSKDEAMRMAVPGFGTDPMEVVKRLEGVEEGRGSFGVGRRSMVNDADMDVNLG